MIEIDETIRNGKVVKPERRKPSVEWFVVLTSLCMVAYGLCVWMEWKMFGWGSIYDDGLTGKWRIIERNLGGFIVTAIASVMVLATVISWWWVPRKWWVMLMVAGATVLGMAQLLPRFDNQGRIAFLKGMAERVKKQVDLKELRAIAAEGNEKRLKAKEVVDPLNNLMVDPRIFVSLRKHEEKEKTIVMDPGRGPVMMVVGPADLKAEPVYQGGVVVEIEPGVYLTYGHGG